MKRLSGLTEKKYKMGKTSPEHHIIIFIFVHGVLVMYLLCFLVRPLLKSSQVQLIEALMF